MEIGYGELLHANFVSYIHEGEGVGIIFIETHGKGGAAVPCVAAYGLLAVDMSKGDVVVTLSESRERHVINGPDCVSEAAMPCEVAACDGEVGHKYGWELLAIALCHLVGEAGKERRLAVVALGGREVLRIYMRHGCNQPLVGHADYVAVEIRLQRVGELQAPQHMNTQFKP